MPLFTVYGKVYDSDGTTVLNNIKVVLTNTTRNSSLNIQTNSAGEFIFNLEDLSSGWGDGDSISIYASYGLNYDEQFYTVVVSDGSKLLNLTLSSSITPAPVYCSIAEVRNFSGVDSAEFSDTAIYDMIKRASSYIDESTGRTWKGIQTATDEAYDGFGNDTLWLNRTDIQGVTAIKIDESDTGTYTTVTSSNTKTSSGAFVYNDEGFLILDDDANVNKFTAGPKTVLVTYTYGNKRPTELVRQIAIALVSNWLHNNLERTRWIEDALEKIKWKGPVSLV